MIRGVDPNRQAARFFGPGPARSAAGAVPGEWAEGGYEPSGMGHRLLDAEKGARPNPLTRTRVPLGAPVAQVTTVNVPDGLPHEDDGQTGLVQLAQLLATRSHPILRGRS